MLHHASAPADEKAASPALLLALRTSEAALADREVQLAEANATVERQARDLAALQLRERAAPTPIAVVERASADPAELAAANAQIEILKAELAVLKGSTSWRVTSPIRSVMGLVRR